MNKSSQFSRFFMIVALLAVIAITIVASPESKPQHGQERRQLQSLDPRSVEEKWPELIGMSGKDVKAQLEADNPSLDIQLVLEDTPMTMDYRTDRVRVMVNDKGMVATAPRVG
mmetsp:Transcript_18616/g.27601  ORF Transcript_18616/g.27601 Transcript_18616/m.27601 type:complete len:113 (+) Transcript_18616:106-444(+)